MQSCDVSLSQDMVQSALICVWWQVTP